MKAYIEILSNNRGEFPRPLVEKWPDVPPNTPAHIVGETFAAWVLEFIDTDFFDYFGDDAFWLHIGRRKGDKFSFRCIAHAGRDVYPFTVLSGDEYMEVL